MKRAPAPIHLQWRISGRKLYLKFLENVCVHVSIFGGWVEQAMTITDLLVEWEP